MTPLFTMFLVRSNKGNEISNIYPPLLEGYLIRGIYLYSYLKVGDCLKQFVYLESPKSATVKDYALVASDMEN